MGVFVYDDSALPVGNPVRMNGSEESYALGLYDGANHGEQYPDEPEETVLFESPDVARAWLAAVTEVLTPYIVMGDREARYPDLDGWEPIPVDS